MTTFVLIPGAGGVAWYWHRVQPLLEQAGHAAVAVDLPGDDERAGLHAYADRVLREIDRALREIDPIGARGAIDVIGTHGTNSDPEVTLVAQSMGGFTAAIVCARAPVSIRRLVFVNAMIPLPGETAGEWWDHTGWLEARHAAAERGGYNVEFDLDIYFLHDVPQAIAQEGAKHQRPESKIAFTEPAAFQCWPDIPIHVVIGKDDRFFPAEFQARIARERLEGIDQGITIDEIPGGHLVALSHPRELARLLLEYVTE